MNFELTSFLNGDIENAVQVYIISHGHSGFELLVGVSKCFSSENLCYNTTWESFFLQSCVTMEQKELLEELAESVGATVGWYTDFAHVIVKPFFIDEICRRVLMDHFSEMEDLLYSCSLDGVSSLHVCSLCSRLSMCR